MSHLPLRLLATPLLLAGAICGCGGGPEAPATVPTARVETAVASAGRLAPLATAYGIASASSTHTRVIAMPFEGAIARVDVHVGDSVRDQQALITIARTPATAAQAAQARSGLSFAEEDYARVERLVADKLATNEQLGAARKALADARAQHEALGASGADRAQTPLQAPFAGVVTSLAAVPGDRPAPGTALATIASAGEVIVQLGLEPADAAKLTAGATVHLLPPTEGAAEILTHLSSVGRALDPTSRVVNAVAPIPAADGNRILLGSTVQARIELPAVSGVLIPRGALLEDAGGPFVFTVEGGKAHRRAVKVGAETAASALTTAGLAAGATVVVAGNAALEEGVAVARAGATP